MVTHRESREGGRTQVTLVAFYGVKPSPFAELITESQALLAGALNGAFHAYGVEQVHATVVGLERLAGTIADNANYRFSRQRTVEMDLDGLLAFLRGAAQLPLEVQIGGFAERTYPFTSRGAAPYTRSFSIQGDKAVMMGWPIRGEPLTRAPTTPAEWVQESRLYPMALDALRHAAARYGVLHAYHAATTDTDNDLFFRLGLVDSDMVEPTALAAAEQRLRQYLSRRPPLIVEVGLTDLHVAAYDDERLPAATTKTWSLADASLTGVLVKELYR